MRVLAITTCSDRPEAETFIGLKKRGVDIEVMCSTESLYYQNLKDSGVPVTDFEVRGRIDLAAIRAIRQHLQTQQFDILHGFNNQTISNALLAATGLPVKVIAYRGIVANVSFFNPGSWMTYLHPKVDNVVCVAEAVRQYFLHMRFLWLRLPPEKFITIYKGHSLDWYQAQPKDLSEFGIPGQAFVVGCITNYRPRKGIEVLIDAARYLPPSAPVHFLLVGHMDSPRLAQHVEQSPMKNRIHLTGYRLDAPALMASCAAYVLPALRREGLPKGVIEAMAYGVPPVVTDSGGSPELIENGISGLIVPPGDPRAIGTALTQLLDQPDLRRRMGDCARERIRAHFCIDDTIVNTFNLYKRLLSA
jgi:glycosyltransferase involved in cell wall biosynthesis